MGVETIQKLIFIVFFTLQGKGEMQTYWLLDSDRKAAKKEVPRYER